MKVVCLAVLMALGLLGAIDAAHAGGARNGKAAAQVNTPKAEAPIACILDSFSPAERDRHRTRLRRLSAMVIERQELADGYAFRFPADAKTVAQLGEWMGVEKECCPFLKFALEAEPKGGPVWVKLTGNV